MLFDPTICFPHATSHRSITWAVIRVNGMICPNCTVAWSVDFGDLTWWSFVESGDSLFLYRPYVSVEPTAGVISVTAEVYCDDALLGQYTATLTLE